MGQSHSSKQNTECNCSCGGSSGNNGSSWDSQSASNGDELQRDGEGTRANAGKSSSVDRYVSAVTERALRREAARRKPWNALRRRTQPHCICTSYRRVADSTPDTTNVTVTRNAQGERCTSCYMCTDDRLAVLAVGMREIRRDLDDWLARISMSTEYANGAPVQGGSGSSCGAAEGSDGGAATVSGAADASNVILVSVTPHSGSSRLEVELEEAKKALKEVVPGTSLRAILLRAPSSSSSAGQLPPARVHTQVDYIHCLVPDLQAITACPFYWGKMDRYEAERLLENKPEGTFLLRDSAQEEHLFSVSFRKYSRSLHARIEHYDRRFSFDSHDPAVFSAHRVLNLIDHYKDPACVMFFEPTLTCPLPRTFPFSLQQLTRAVIVSKTTYDGVDELPLPARLRAYLKEYHYRQRVRVRCLDHVHYRHIA